MLLEALERYLRWKARRARSAEDACAGMATLLTILRDDLGLLLAPDRFRFVDSESSEGFDNAFIEMRSDTMRVRLVSDRGFVSMDFSATDPSGDLPPRWHDHQLVLQLLTGKAFGGMLTGYQLNLMRKRFSEIEARFGPGRLAETEAELDRLGRARGDEMFGPSLADDGSND